MNIYKVETFGCVDDTHFWIDQAGYVEGYFSSMRKAKAAVAYLHQYITSVEIDGRLTSGMAGNDIVWIIEQIEVR